MPFSLANTLGVFATTYLYFTSRNSVCLGESVSLNGLEPTSSIAQLSLVENEARNIMNTNGYYVCNHNRVNSLCAYLDITNNKCEGIETIKVSVYGARVSGDVDVFGIFGIENSNGNFEQLSFFSDWDGSVRAVEGSGITGGVYTSPSCGANELLYTRNGGVEVLDTILSDLTSGTTADAWTSRERVAGSTDWEILATERVGDSRSPLVYTIINDNINNQIKTLFEAPGLSTNTECIRDGITFDTNSGNNYRMAFGSDQGTIKFTKFNIDITCEIPKTYKCHTWGDPHTKTFDGTKYHFQGEGYFYYVKSCDNSYNYLPFNIIAKHEYCGSRQTRTCVKQVAVELLQNKNIFFQPNGNPTFNDGTSAIGDHSYIDNMLGDEVIYKVTNNQIEIKFMYSNKLTSLKLTYKGTTLDIETSEYLYGDNLLCGLCGNINEDTTDDFTRCDDYLVEIDNTNSEIAFLDSLAWDNTHEFGESCCNKEFDLNYIGNTDCGEIITIPPKPETECMDNSSKICSKFHEEYCNCDGLNIITNEWIDSCAMDFCADDVCSDMAIGNSRLSLTDSIDKGCLDTVINECVAEKFGPVSSRF
jgi:hypothetical protein